MIKELKMYTVVCDNCGKDSNDGTDYSCWSDAEQAEWNAYYISQNEPEINKANYLISVSSLNKCRPPLKEIINLKK